MIPLPELLFSPDFLLVVAWIGAALGLAGSLFGGGSKKSKNKSGPPAYAQEAGRTLLDYALGRDSEATAGLPSGSDLLAAAGPTLGQELSLPGVNWYDALKSGPTGQTGADGTMMGSAMGGGSALDGVFGKLMERSRMPAPGSNKKAKTEPDPNELNNLLKKYHQFSQMGGSPYAQMNPEYRKLGMELGLMAKPKPGTLMQSIFARGS